MNSNDAKPSYETIEIGTPRDYTNDIYKVYFEVGEYDGIVLNILKSFLGEEKEKCINVLAHGYEVELPIQCVPELISLINEQNIAIYQVVRYAKLNKEWD